MAKMYIYHHNDHDGIAAAAVAYRYFIKKEWFRDNDIIFNMIDYDKELNFDHINFDKGDKVLFLDYSFTNEYNKNEFKKLLDRRLDNDIYSVVWIDHHVSSIDVFKEYNIPGHINTSVCATALTYLYFNETYSCDSNLHDVFHNKLDSVPLILKYIDDYDCWKKNYKITDYVHYGLQLSDPRDPKFQKMLRRDDPDEISRIVENGEAVLNYLKFEDREYHINMYGFEYELYVNGRKYSLFCINRKGNSIMFGDKINEYDAVVPFYFTNGKWKYSIFTTKDDVNCEEIAKFFGGGGHVKAAGWQTDKLIFKN